MTKKQNRKASKSGIWRFVITTFSVVTIIAFLYSQNHWLEITNYSFTKSLSEPIRIIQLSDLHGLILSKDNKKIISQVEKQNADIILVTGDWIDESKNNFGVMSDLMSQLTRICPVFYIPGNHEYRSDELSWGNALESDSISMMHNEIRSITIKGVVINILGLDEVLMPMGSEEQKLLFDDLSTKSGIKIVLSHYPENFALAGVDSYQNKTFDYQFSGHAHGGQFIIPAICGIYAPGQGLFPKYYKGVYNSEPNVNGIIDKEAPVLIVNRGLGNSVIPQRIFNRPEIVVVEIK